MADALFGRALRDGNQLLWAEDAALPELRGAEQADAGGEGAFTDDQPRVDVSMQRVFRDDRPFQNEDSAVHGSQLLGRKTQRCRSCGVLSKGTPPARLRSPMASPM